MFSLSVCMIVKNEEKVLERILKQVKSFAEQIVVVDTGSTDETKKIAKKYTNDVFSYVWKDDFSKARNYSFSKAKCDYVMWLDADDFITQENIEKIKELKQNDTDVDVFMLKYEMGFDQNDKPCFVFYRERILKRSKNFKWQGFIHEAISPSGKIEYVDISIQHRKIKSEPKRNINMFRQAIKNGIKFSPREQYYYARELYYNGHYKKAILNFKKHLNMNDPYYANVQGSILLLCECLLYVGKTQQAKKYIFKAFEKFNPTSEMCCMAGNIFEKLGGFECSIFWYESALVCGEQKHGFVREEFSNFVPFMKLTYLYYKVGDFQKSKKYHEKAKEIRPDNQNVLFNQQFFN